MSSAETGARARKTRRGRALLLGWWTRTCRGPPEVLGGHGLTDTAPGQFTLATREHGNPSSSARLAADGNLTTPVFNLFLSFFYY
jgi:hypothetical protein